MSQEATDITPLLVTEDNITGLAEQRWGNRTGSATG